MSARLVCESDNDVVEQNKKSALIDGQPVNYSSSPPIDLGMTFELTEDDIEIIHEMTDDFNEDEPTVEINPPSMKAIASYYETAWEEK